MKKRMSLRRFQGTAVMLLCLAVLVLMATRHIQAAVALLSSALPIYWLYRSINYIRSKRTEHWQYAQAEVNRVGILKIHHKYSAASKFVVVEYSYEVDGKKFENDLYSLFPHTVCRNIQTEAYYRTLKTMPVYFNPVKPRQSVEKKGPQTTLIDPLLLGITVFFEAVLIVFLFVLIKGGL